MPGRYLVTGVAGSGKTTLEKELRQRGHITIDIDDGYAQWRRAGTDEVLAYTPDEEGWHEIAEWVVDTDKLQGFFDTHRHETVLVCGSFARQKEVVGMFDVIFLLEYMPDMVTSAASAGGVERCVHRDRSVAHGRRHDRALDVRT